MAAQEDEHFTLIDADSPQSLLPDYKILTSAKTADIDNQIQLSLRKLYPELNLTVVKSGNCPLIDFAHAGNATATLDTETDTVLRWRGYVPPAHRGGTGGLGDTVFYAKYHYKWGQHDFIIYTIGPAFSLMQYILKEPSTQTGEDTLSHCAITDALILAGVKFATGDENKFIYVYDGYWQRSAMLFKEVQKASWEKVILAPSMKKALKSVSNSFFDSKEVYKRYGVPWRRGLIFYGPPGNGKTISIKALMHELSLHKGGKEPIPTLYVKSAPRTFDIHNVFTLARQFSPCLLIMEDVETIVTMQTRSYFFNEVDGLENNDGILMVASTNYLDRLDPGLSQRPSRFDRKYNFRLPNMHQRTLYAEFWRSKLTKTDSKIEFPDELCEAVAKITGDFSFAYMQEAFVAALLELAQGELGLRMEALYDELDATEYYDCDNGDEEQGEHEDDVGQRIADEYNDNFGNAKEGDDKGDSLDKYKLWRALKRAVAALRKDLKRGDGEGELNGPRISGPAPITHPDSSVGILHSNRTPSSSARLPNRGQWQPAPRSNGSFPDYDTAHSVASTRPFVTNAHAMHSQGLLHGTEEAFRTHDLGIAQPVAVEFDESEEPWQACKMDIRVAGEATRTQLASQGILKRQNLAQTAMEWK